MVTEKFKTEKKEKKILARGSTTFRKRSKKKEKLTGWEKGKERGTTEASVGGRKKLHAENKNMCSA